MPILEKTLEKPFQEIPKYRDFRLEVERRRKEGTLRYVVLKGGRGSAKTRHAVEMLTRFLFGWRDRIYCIRKNEAQNRESIYAELLSHLKVPRADGVKILPNMYRVGKSPKKIETRNRTGKRGEVVWAGLRFSDRSKGSFRPDVSMLEEASEYNYEDFITYEQSVRHKGAIIILLFNPPHEGKDSWIYKHFFSKDASQDVLDATLILETDYRDNPYLDPLAVKAYEALEKTNPYEYQRSVLGLWVKNQESLVYPKIQEVSSDFKPTLQSICLQGLDFGHTDPCAMVRLHYWKEKGEYFVYIEKEKYKSGLDTQSMINYLSGWRRIKDTLTHADSSHPTHIKDLKLAKFNVTNVKKGAGSVLLGINFIKSCHILINKECTNFLKEIKSYAWKKNPNGGFMYGVLAEGQSDHLMDAFRYALEPIILKDYSKSSLGSVR